MFHMYFGTLISDKIYSIHTFFKFVLTRPLSICFVLPSCDVAVGAVGGRWHPRGGYLARGVNLLGATCKGVLTVYVPNYSSAFCAFFATLFTSFCEEPMLDILSP